MVGANTAVLARTLVYDVNNCKDCLNYQKRIPSQDKSLQLYILIMVSPQIPKGNHELSNELFQSINYARQQSSMSSV